MAAHVLGRGLPSSVRCLMLILGQCCRKLGVSGLNLSLGCENSPLRSLQPIAIRSEASDLASGPCDRAPVTLEICGRSGCRTFEQARPISRRRI